MLTTTLVAHPWLTTVALAAVVLAGPILGAWLAPRPRIASALLTPATMVVGLFTLLPVDRKVELGCQVEWNVPSLGAVEMIANIVLFVPAVLLAAVLTGRPWLVFIAGCGAAALIETVQALLPVLGRSCSTSDWLANALGALLGAVLAAVALWIDRRGDLPTQ